MTYIYIDESGDLGFSKKGSSYFILSCVKVEGDKAHTELRRIPKKIRQRKLGKRHQKTPELKFSNSSKLIREQFLSRINKLDIEVYSLIVKKEFTQDKLKDKLAILYNYLMKILLEKPLKGMSGRQKINICLDKCMSNRQYENFEAYIKTEFLSRFGDIPSIRIFQESSHNSSCLQVIDFICGSFGYKYNTMKLKQGSGYYTNMIRDKIIMEKNDFFKK